jgi:chromosome segregation ATPase
MRNKACFSGLGLLVLFLFTPDATMAQDDKKTAELKRLDEAVIMARSKVAKYERLLVVADSLISKGTEQITESKAEAKSISAERKTLDKAYAASKKSLEKLSVSKDKAEATQAKADIKALDLKYKADAKAFDTRLKEATKKSTTGSSNLSKGKTNKKTAEDGLKTAQASLDAAQARYDAATGGGDESGEPKNKKK